MTIPLPEPFAATLLDLLHEIRHAGTMTETVIATCEISKEIRAYAAAVRAEERDWWREIAEQLIACHDEPTCPAVTLARERLDGHIRKGE